MNKKKYVQRTYIASIITIFFYAGASVLIPLSIESIRADLSLTYTQGGIYSFISSIEQFAIMIITCFLAAKFGKIRIIRIGILFLSVGLFLFSKSNFFLISIFFYLIVGVGHGFIEAMLTPLTVDLYPEDKGSRQILLHAFWSIAIITISPIVGFALSSGVSWRTIFTIFSIIILGVVFAFPPSKHLGLPKSSTDILHMKEIFFSRIFWLFVFAIIFAGATEGAFTYWISSYIQNIYSVSQFEGAMGTTFFASGMALGRIGFSRLAKVISLMEIILFSAAILVVFGISIFFVKSLYLLYFIVFLSGTMIAPFWPSLQLYAVKVIKKDPTLIMVFLSCFGVPGFSFSVMAVGILADLVGFTYAMSVIPLFSSMLIITVLIINSYRKKHLGEH